MATTTTTTTLTTSNANHASIVAPSLYFLMVIHFFAPEVGTSQKMPAVKTCKKTSKTGKLSDSLHELHQGRANATTDLPHTSLISLGSESLR